MWKRGQRINNSFDVNSGDVHWKFIFESFHTGLINDHHTQKVRRVKSLVKKLKILIYFVFIPGTLEFSQNHPLASLFVVIVSGYGGKFIANFLLGMSIIEVIQYEALVLIASIVW